MKLVCVTASQAPLSELSVCTCKCSVHELQKAQTILSGSSEDADLMLEDELRALSMEKKEQLLHDAGITVNIPLMQGLAIKSMLSIP